MRDCGLLIEITEMLHISSEWFVQSPIFDTITDEQRSQHHNQ